MLRLTKQGQHVPRMVNAPAVGGCASVLVRKCVHCSGWKKKEKKKPETAATNFQTLSFWVGLRS